MASLGNSVEGDFKGKSKKRTLDSAESLNTMEKTSRKNQSPEGESTLKRKGKVSGEGREISQGGIL